MEKKNVVSIEDRIPKLKEARKKKANRRLLFYLSIFFLLISAIVYVQSPLSHIKVIEVSGNNYMKEKEVIKLSGLTTDTNIWVYNKKSITDSIKEHPMIEDIEIKRKLPQTVHIKVKEQNVVGYIQNDLAFQPVLENGMIVTTGDITNKGDGPLLNNFDDEQYLQRIATELSKIPDDIFNLISEVTWQPTEKNKYRIVLYMNDGYVVHATIRNFANKMAIYPSIVSQLNPEDKGIVHMGVGTYFEKLE
ncbi:MAG TPA: FtsQ-type POTRA domain-containing protein [Pseudogracilibacillus sp.]|nr:FtsQ-type POTRA domain-containing protein [Pseudogracilibacillus sp.]